MVFCGNCGYQLRSGNAVCPRCGTPTVTMPTVGEPDADAPTIASTFVQQLYKPQDNEGAAPPQQPLVLHSPDGGFNTSTPYPVYSSQPQDLPYPDFSSQGGPATSMPELLTPPPVRTRKRGRVITLLLALFLLLCVIGAFAVFLFLRHSTPTPPTPSQQAQTLLQQFYNDINNRDYQGAYALLGHNFQSRQSYSNFANGFMHTRHDDISFDSITPLADGTLNVSVTIHATEDAASGTGTQLSTYKGGYIVGQENGSWKILSGQLNRV
jgi:hypothetical protein